MTKVSERVHSGGTVSEILRFVEAGNTFYTTQFPPPARILISGRHITEAAAQAEADGIMAHHGHHCGGDCTPWLSTGE